MRAECTMHHKQMRLACVGAALLAVLLAIPGAAASRQLSAVMFHGKGPKYAVFAPATGAFVQQRTYFVPAAAPPVVAAYAQPVAPPVVASAVQPVVAQQPLVVAAQPTVVAAQPTIVAAAPSFVAAAPPKIDLGVKMNVGIELQKSMQGDVVSMFKGHHHG